MVRVIPAGVEGARVPIQIWARDAPEDAVRQLQRLAAEPYVVDHVAAMPDLHLASGVAVGTVFATDRVVVPSALGGDLGCGVAALRLAFTHGPSKHDLERILAGWTALIPVGDATQRGRGSPVPEDVMAAPLSTHALDRERHRLAPRHLGTLGGGNHFVELDRSMSNELWLLVHTGSRGLGGAVGAHHAKVAAASGRGTLPGLDVDSEAGAACLADVSWAVRFAEANRRAVLMTSARLVGEVLDAVPEDASLIDIRHNYVAEEEHLGRRLLVHRKGAIAAPEEVTVVIPGSMGTASYLALGRGEANSFRSASHGAGRVMSRREARARIPISRLEHAMRRVVHDQRRAASLVEEAPSAYRDVREVLADEADLVTPLERLEPLVVLKG